MLRRPIATISYSKNINVVSLHSSLLGTSFDASKVQEQRKAAAKTAQIHTTNVGKNWCSQRGYFISNHIPLQDSNHMSLSRQNHICLPPFHRGAALPSITPVQPGSVQLLSPGAQGRCLGRQCSIRRELRILSTAQRHTLLVQPPSSD
jgi:hypothetical protein